MRFYRFIFPYTKANPCYNIFMQQNSSQPDDLYTQLSGLDKETLVDLITQAVTENTLVRWEIINLLRKISVSQVASENADCHPTAIHSPQTTTIVNRKSTAQEKIFDSRTSILIKQLQHAGGCTIKYAPNLVQKFAVIDTHTVWYGSSNLLGFTAEDDCMMRLCDSKIGAELESVVWGGGGIR